MFGLETLKTLSMSNTIAEFLLTKPHVLDLITQTYWPDKEQLDWRFLSRSEIIYTKPTKKSFDVKDETSIIFKTVLTLRSV